METRKILGIIFSLVFLCAFGFVLTWGIINFKKVKKGMSGTQLYTNVDLENSYQDGYDTALKDKEEYTELINGYRDTITTLNDNISQLNSQITLLTNNNTDFQAQITSLSTQKRNLETQVGNLNTIKTNNETAISNLNTQISTLQGQVSSLSTSETNKETQIEELNTQILTLQATVVQLQQTNSLNVNTITSLNSQIEALTNQLSSITSQIQNNSSTVGDLNTQIIELQNSVSYYESYIAQLENGEQVVITFEYDNSVYNIQIVNKGSTVTLINPVNTPTKIFNGWIWHDEIIDLSSFEFYYNTKLIADTTYKHNVSFMVDNVAYQSIIVDDEGYFVAPETNPTKEGYEFDGWSLNNVDILETVENIEVTQDLNIYAMFTKIHTVNFMYEDDIVETQYIRNGNCATTYTPEGDSHLVFNGWSINEELITVDEYEIYSDTLFMADITYKHIVNYYFEGELIGTNYVLDTEALTPPANPTKYNYKFKGWQSEAHLGGGNYYSSLYSLRVTQDSNLYAYFRMHFTSYPSDYNDYLELQDGDILIMPTNNSANKTNKVMARYNWESDSFTVINSSCRICSSILMDDGRVIIVNRSQYSSPSATFSDGFYMFEPSDNSLTRITVASGNRASSFIQYKTAFENNDILMTDYDKPLLILYSYSTNEIISLTQFMSGDLLTAWELAQTSNYIRSITNITENSVHIIWSNGSGYYYSVDYDATSRTFSNFQSGITV